MKLTKISLVLLLSLFLLTGCGDKSKDKAIAILNDYMTIEQQFDAILKNIVELENKDQQMYQEILNQGKKNSKQAESSIAIALDTVEERKAAIEQSKIVLQSADQEFNSLEQVIKKIKNVSDKKHGQKLLDLFNARNKIFDDLYSQYMTGLNLDKELFQMLGDDKSHLKEINQQIAKRNLAFDEVSKSMTEFNRVSELFQQEIMSFLNTIGIPDPASSQ